MAHGLISALLSCVDVSNALFDCGRVCLAVAVVVFCLRAAVKRDAVVRASREETEEMGVGVENAVVTKDFPVASVRDVLELGEFGGTDDAEVDDEEAIELVDLRSRLV